MTDPVNPVNPDSAQTAENQSNNQYMVLLILVVISLLIGAVGSYLVFNKSSALDEYKQQVSSFENANKKLDDENTALKRKLLGKPEFVGLTADEMKKAIQDASKDAPCLKSAVVEKPKAVKATTAYRPAEKSVYKPVSPSTKTSEGETVKKPYEPWGFVQYDATVSNPKTCFSTDKIAGELPRCTSVEVVPAKANETQSQWLARMASEQLKMKGFTTKILGKS